VIGGWLGGDGGRTGRLGSLAVGFYKDGELRYAGKVGTGFTDAELDRVARLLEPLERPTTPFTGPQPPRATHFVEPRLVASVEYTELTRIGTLRHPSYKGLRDDLDPAQVGPPEDA
jgi:bifunctional non-homologous end joining protein LigD